MSSSLARLRIVAINDVYSLSNLPRFQTFLTQLNPKPSAVVLAGDFLSPSTLSSIDCGRGMVATLRAVGLSHVSLGNHEQDIRLDSLNQRLSDLSKSATVLNTNMREQLPTGAQWVPHVTVPFSIVESPCKRVKAALTGLMSDEPGIFRDNTFKGIPISNVVESFSQLHSQLIPEHADLCIAMTHASIHRDRELAEEMLRLQADDSVRGAVSGLIIGGHEHEPFDEFVTNDDEGNERSIRILKSGMDATAASLIDLTFETRIDETGRSQLVDVDYELVEMKDYEPSVVVQKIVDKHESVVKALENETIVDAAKTSVLPPGVCLSSERTRFEQTSIGSVFCQMIKEEHEVDAAIINGATIKGNKQYPDGTLSYAQLKNELPFPTKLVFVSMPRYVLDEAITYSRTAVEDNSDPGTTEVARRGYLQVDWDYQQRNTVEFTDELVRVALPRNLLNGFCEIKPLVDWGERLKEENIFPGEDDYVPALNSIVRYSCKNRWASIVSDVNAFHEFDLNGDGVLDRFEIVQMMRQYLGYTPADFVIDDMLAAIDTDENGVIDQGEFSFLLAEMEREKGRLA